MVHARRVLLCALAMLVFAVTGCGQSPQQKTFKKFVTGLRDRQFRNVADTLSNETLDQAINGALPPARMLAHVPVGPANELVGLFAKNGVDLKTIPPQTTNAEIMTRLDRVGFMGDVLEFATKMKEAKESKQVNEMIKLGDDPNAKLADVKVTGQTAEGNAYYTIDGKKMKEPLKFVYQDGDWRLAFVPSTPNSNASRSGPSGGGVAVLASGPGGHGGPPGMHGAVLAQNSPAPSSHGSPDAHGTAPSAHEAAPMPVPNPEATSQTPPGHGAPNTTPTPQPAPGTPNAHGNGSAETPVPMPQPSGQTPGGHGSGGNDPAPGAMPPGEGSAGTPGPSAPAGGGGVPTFKEGTAEYAVQKVCLQVAAGNITGMESVIMESAKGLAAKFRSGDVTTEEIEKLKKQFTNVKLISSKSTGGGRQITLMNEDREPIVFLASKEDEVFRVKEVTIKPAARGAKKR